jgi:hypothetical protein
MGRHHRARFSRRAGFDLEVLYLKRFAHPVQCTDLSLVSDRRLHSTRLSLSKGVVMKIEVVIFAAFLGFLGGWMLRVASGGLPALLLGQ